MNWKEQLLDFKLSELKKNYDLRKLYLFFHYPLFCLENINGQKIYHYDLNINNVPHKMDISDIEDAVDEQFFKFKTELFKLKENGFNINLLLSGEMFDSKYNVFNNNLTPYHNFLLMLYFLNKDFNFNVSFIFDN